MTRDWTVFKILVSYSIDKTKYIHANQAPFMNKELQKAIMIRSKLRNSFLGNRNEFHKKAYFKQINIYVNVFCKTKKQYYSNFEVCKVADKIFFWKTMKCFFSNKSNNFGTITLIKNNMVISDDHEIVDIFLEYFDTAVPKLGLAILKYVIFTANCIERILFLKQCINIKGILEYLDSTKIIKTWICLFPVLSLSNLQNELGSLDPSKLSRETEIPTKILKDRTVIFSPFLLNYFNNIVDSSYFPNYWKLANITPVDKKDSQSDKRIYLPVSVLSNRSKVFENILNQQINARFENIFYKHETGFSRGYNTQHCLLVMLEEFWKALGKGGNYAALLTNQSKAYDCIPHDLIVAKLHSCGFDMPSVKLMNGYLTNKHRRVKINDSYSLWKL